MAYQYQRSCTEGSNALKTEELGFDVFVKPQFLAERTTASIIDFDEAREGYLRDSGSYEWGVDAGTEPEASRTLSSRLIRFMKNDRMLSGFFAPRKENAYRREDLLVFAKGFSVTGITAFILILFGA